MYKNFFKRIIGFVITLIGFICISPVFVLLCIFVRIKLGSPVFFKQVRITKGEKPFTIMKFRTMSDARDAEGNLLPDTERFTKFGNFLRNSSLDELPELINVLKGDMSLVGPRPLYPFYLPYYKKEENLRHTVRAGITGLAQVNGRNLCKWDERFALDVKYVKELSLINDIKILWRTFFKVAAQEDIGVPSVDEELGLHIVREVQQPDKMDLLKKMEGGAKIPRSLLSSFQVPRIREIGSFFWLTEKEYKSISTSIEQSSYTQKQEVLLSTCRSAIKEVIKTVHGSNKVALVPAFTCHSVIEPFVDEGYTVKPYPVLRDFSINPEAFEECVEKCRPSIILVHSYFGFDTLRTIRDYLNQLSDQGIIVIEDYTQRILSTFPSLNASFDVGSIRKWYPTPDGAFVTGLSEIRLDKEDKELEELKIKALLDKGKYVESGSVDKQTFMKEAIDAESFLDTRTDTYKMSRVSSSIIASSDIEYIKKKRKANCRVLQDHLNSNDLFDVIFKETNETEVPFMFPVLVKKNRKEFQKYLAEHSIYATIIWACPDEIESKVDDNSRRIYNEILCIPIDQMYDNDDMQRIVYTINRYLVNEK